MNKYAQIKERVVKLRSNVQILCQIYQERDFRRKSEIDIEFELNMQFVQANSYVMG